MGTFVPDDGIHRCPECQHVFDHLKVRASMGNHVEVEGLCGNIKCDLSKVEYRRHSSDISEKELEEYYDNYC